MKSGRMLPPNTFPLPDAITKLIRFEKDKDFRAALSCCWNFLRPLCEKSVHVEDYPEAKVITILGGHIVIEKSRDRPFIHVSRLNPSMDVFHLAMYPALDAVLRPGEEVEILWGFHSKLFSSCFGMPGNANLKSSLDHANSQHAEKLEQEYERCEDIFETAMTIIIKTLKEIGLISSEAINSRVYQVLELDEDVAELTRHFMGQVRGDAYCVAWQHQKMLRKYYQARQPLRHLLMSALIEGAIFASSDMLVDLSAALHRRGISRTGMRRFMTLNGHSLHLLQNIQPLAENPTQVDQPLSVLVRAILLLQRLPPTKFDMWLDLIFEWAELYQYVLFEERVECAPQNRHAEAFMRVLAREVARRPAQDFEALRLELRQVVEWITCREDGIVFSFPVIHENCEKSGWRWFVMHSRKVAA